MKKQTPPTKTAAPVKPVPQPINKKSTAVAVTQPPPGMEDMLLQDAGSGLADMGRDDLAIPRLGILQALSPQVDKRDPLYIEGASAGDVYDNIALQIHSGEKGFQAIIVSYRKAQLEWVPRNKGGGFVADHGEDVSVLERCKQVEGKFVTPEGNEIVTTAEYFLLVLDAEGTPRQAVISMSNTQLKHSRRLNTLMSTYMIPHPQDKLKKIQAPIFYRSYTFQTAPEKNEKGSWFGWLIEPSADTLSLPNGTELYMLARSFREQVAQGKVKVAEPHDQKATEDGKEAF